MRGRNREALVNLLQEVQVFQKASKFPQNQKKEGVSTSSGSLACL